MKKLSILILMLVSSAGILRSMPDPHDSLLIDGDNGYSTVFFKKADERCKILVLNVFGKVTGTFLVEKKSMGCGEEGEREFAEKKGDILSDLYDLAPGDGNGIKTGKDGAILLQLSDGTKIALHNNTSITLPNDYCYKDFNSIILKNGAIKILETGTKTTDIGTLRTKTKNKKTQYTVSIINDYDTIDIIKVYEGSVEVSLANPDKSNLDESSDRIEQLTKDLQEGKITMEEFQAKVTEYQAQIEKQASEILPVIVGAGYKCTATKNSLKVEPIEENDNRWWEEIEHK